VLLWPRRLNKPVERPFRVFEAINQDRTFTGEVTACELHPVGHGTSVIGVWEIFFIRLFVQL
jgi:hypothetical protein